MKSMIEKVFSIKALVALLLVFATSGAWADFAKTNPVTGETETYANKFTGGSDGTGTEWSNSSNWDPTVTPFVSGDYNASLVDGKKASTSTAIDGYTLRVGAYNGAAVTWSGGITKIQAGSAGCWLTADATSSITLAFNGNYKQLEGSDAYPFKLSSANAGGITWTSGLSNAGNTSLPFWYYLKGTGTVVYGGDITVANAQVIKMADVTLSGNEKSVQSKTLVSFGSGTTKTFSADAAIKVYDTDGTTLKKTVKLVTVRQAGVAIENATSTLTTGDSVGSCEIVQCTDGIVLYYVDGAPDTIAAYKPSININFTNGAANGLTTTSDVGLEGYAVPGTAWNNFEVANNTTYSTVNAVDSTGVTSVASGVSVTVSGTRGHWNCSGLTPASNPLHGYIDESADQATPTVTITGIPYDHYRVIVYHSTDTANAQFGYDTINGFNFTYVDGVQQTGTTSWGNAGASNSAEAIAEGVNTLVSAVLTGDTVTMVAHRIGGNYPSARGCFAAIQVVEYVPEVSENDLEIAVDGARNYAVDEAKTLSGTVYLTGSGTLTLTGSEKITAATIDVAKDVVLNINADRLDATTFTGSGTVVYDKTAPVTGKGWAAIGWSGTVWVKNQAVSDFNGNNFGNAASTIRFTGVTGYLSRKTTDGVTQSVPIELVDDGSTVAFSYNNGWGGSVVVVSTLKGTGTFKTSTAGNGEIIYFANADAFTGSFDLAYKKVQIGGSEPSGSDQYWNGRLYIPSGVTVTQAAGTTWSANNSIDIAGTLYANGTLASSHASQAVIGSGTVVFTDRAPTPTGDTWWKNSNWTGTVQMKDVTNLVGGTNWTGTNFLPVEYGNTGSVLELYNCSGWLPNNSNYQCTVPLKITGTLTINNGISGSKFVISSLSGSGTIYTSNNSATTTLQVLEASGFTGKVQLNSKRVVFGNTLPSEYTGGNIYVGEGFTFTVPNSDVAWYGTGGITLAGELKATSLNNLGGGTTVTTTDTGVFTLINSNNTQDHSVDYARITGTGTLRYADVSGKWRSLARTNFPTGMICENNLSAGLILTGTSDNTIGSLSGSGVMRSDWGGSANDNGRPVTILQAKDTVYSGVFHSDDRISTVTVAAGATTSGTLTLSGTQTVSNGLNVQAGVNLIGTWKGDTTVSGTFGGTGTLTGNLTFSDGATFKANTSALTISGSNTVTFPSEGSVTVDLTSIELSSSGTTLISGASSIANSANLTASGAYFAVEDDGTKSLVAYAHVATYSGVKYATFADAIAAALADEGGEANLASITVVDATAELPAGYLIVDNNVVKAQGAIVDTEGTAHYYATPTAAAADIDSYLGMGNQTTYSYFAVYFGTDVEMSVNLGAMAWNVFYVKVKCLNDATVSVVPNSVEYEFSAGEPDENSIVTYTKSEKATTYVWVGTGESSTSWGNYNKWKIGTSEGAAAARAPSTLDTVIINGGAPILISGVTVAAMQIGGDAKISGSGTLTATTGGIVLTDAAATLTVTGVTLSPAPTTPLDYYEVVESDGTYSVNKLAEASTESVDGVGEVAVITPEEGVTSITVPAGTTKVAIPGTVTNITGIEAGNLLLKVAYNDGSAQTAYYTNVLAVAGGVVSLDGTKKVTIGGVDVSVEPEVNVASSPMTLSGATPGFTVKTIPGLFYVAETCGTPNGTFTNAGNPQQATSASTTLSTNNDSWGVDEKVRYYRIKVSTTGN